MALKHAVWPHSTSPVRGIRALEALRRLGRELLAGLGQQIYHDCWIAWRAGLVHPDRPPAKAARQAGLPHPRPEFFFFFFFSGFILATPDRDRDDLLVKIAKPEPGQRRGGGRRRPGEGSREQRRNSRCTNTCVKRCSARGLSRSSSPPARFTGFRGYLALKRGIAFERKPSLVAGSPFDPGRVAQSSLTRRVDRLT